MNNRATIILYCLLLIAFTSRSQPVITINEFMASNEHTVANQDGEYDDWIELYNSSLADVNISGYFLSDNPDNPAKYELPEGTIIKARGILIIWADENGKQVGLHANFKLSAAGESLLLLSRDTLQLERIDYGVQVADISYARMPDGSGSFQMATPTFKALNDPTSAVKVTLMDMGITCYPNPAQKYLIISAADNAVKLGTLYNLQGQALINFSLTNEKQLNLSELAQGYYVLTIQGVSELWYIKS